MAAQEQSLLNVQKNLSGTMVNVEKNLIKSLEDIEQNIIKKMNEKNPIINDNYIKKLPFGIHILELPVTKKGLLWFAESQSMPDSYFGIENSLNDDIGKTLRAPCLGSCWRKDGNQPEPALNYYTSSCLTVWENQWGYARFSMRGFVPYYLEMSDAIFSKYNISDVALLLDTMIDEANSDLASFVSPLKSGQAHLNVNWPDRAIADAIFVACVFPKAIFAPSDFVEGCMEHVAGLTNSVLDRGVCKKPGYHQLRQTIELENNNEVDKLCEIIKKNPPIAEEWCLAVKRNKYDANFELIKDSTKTVVLFQCHPTPPPEYANMPSPGQRCVLIDPQNPVID